MADIMDAYMDNLFGLQDYFGSEIISYAKIIGSNLARQVKSNQMQLQRKFHQNIYSRGYGVLSACCNNANSWIQSCRYAAVESVGLALKEIYDTKQAEFMCHFSEICQNAGLASVTGNLAKKAVPSVKAYFRAASFGVIDFPQLLFMRNNVARESYIDRVVHEKLERFADNWNRDCSTLVSVDVKEMNLAGNAMVQTQSAMMRDISDGYRKNSRQMAESSFYTGLKAVLQDIIELKRLAEDNLPDLIDSPARKKPEWFENRCDNAYGSTAQMENLQLILKGGSETALYRLILVLRKIMEQKVHMRDIFPQHMDKVVCKEQDQIANSWDRNCCASEEDFV